MKFFKSYFYFCLQYVRTIPLYDFNLSFLKIILKKSYLRTFAVGGMPTISCNFKTKKLPIFDSQTTPIFPILTYIFSCVLHHINYQCLSQTKLNFTHVNQYSKHQENGQEIARNSKTRQKLLVDSRLKRERNRVHKKKSLNRKKRRMFRRRY